MSCLKFSTVAVMLLSAEAYKFQPLTAPSPGTVSSTITVPIGAASARGNPGLGAFNTVQATASSTQSAGITAGPVVYTTVTAFITTGTTATTLAAATDGDAGAIAMTQPPMVQNGGSIGMDFTAGTVYTQTLVNSATGPKFTKLYCGPLIDTEATSATTGADCSASATLQGRTGYMEVGTYDATTATTTTITFAPPTDLAPTSFNGRFLCWFGTAATTEAAVTNACPNVASNAMFQKVVSVGTATATPTPLPMSPSPSAMSPSASPTSGAFVASSMGFLSLLVATLMAC